ncbi:hypothetical protein GCM10023196_022290 [Actinoallomurus vinaceus]|uniref:Uncharacterized protein n=1 Tax=Actinoallomurus vinaceus TaxID=1080074 RepID=A0ABP8U6H8_9ACTN
MEDAVAGRFSATLDPPQAAALAGDEIKVSWPARSAIAAMAMRRTCAGVRRRTAERGMDCMRAPFLAEGDAAHDRVRGRRRDVAGAVATSAGCRRAPAELPTESALREKVDLFPRTVKSIDR